MATRQDEPASGCKATKEELLNQKKNPLDISDDCPVCERRGVLCEVANHPSRPLLTSLVRPKSPPYRTSTFIFYVAQRNRAIVPLGTAVAIECISKLILLTAGHCCYVDSTHTRILRNNLFCTTSIEKGADGAAVVSGPSFPVRAVHCSYVPDIAILARTDNIQFQRVIPLCPRDEIPWEQDPDGWEVSVKFFHCPVDFFLTSDATILSCEITAYQQVSSHSDHHFVVREEFLGGSSGGAVVLPYDRGSKLLGILITTLTSPLVIDVDSEEATVGGSLAYTVVNPALSVTTCVIPSSLNFHDAGGNIVDFVSFIRSLGY